MQIHDRVRVHTDNPHLKDMIDGKEGTIIEPDEFRTWVVHIPGTPRIYGFFALDETNLEVI